MTQQSLQEQYDVCVPCRAACPIRTDVPGYIEAVLDRNMDQAQAINRRDNIFPGVLGRVCHRPCEPACRHGRKGLGDPLQICFLKRAAADLSQSSPPLLPGPDNGKHICVIGSGPSGLTVANDLALAGCKVTVLEQYHEPGGMMRFGIPEFRLPREVLAKDIQSILQLGIELKTDTRISSNDQLEQLRRRYDAVVIAGGCMKAGILTQQDPSFMHSIPGLDYMQEANTGRLGESTPRIVVIGGGFTAVDCARTALRHGAKKVTLVYRRTRDHMRVGPNEIRALEEEGVDTLFLHTPRRILEKNNLIHGIECTPTRLDSSGQLHDMGEPHIVIDADAVILAIGQETDDSLQVDPSLHSTSGIFLTGDFRDGSGTVIEACAAGRQTAQHILKYLGLATSSPEVRLTPVPRHIWKRTLTDNSIPAERMPCTAPETRMDQSIEVEQGLTSTQACEEARRCYLCHYRFTIDSDRCIYCMKCIDAMPVDCIHLSKGGIEFNMGQIEFTHEPHYNASDGIVIDHDACVRCGECLRVCPVDCIAIEQFSIVPNQP